ncbi:ATP-binding cassette domain-containing protein [Blautia obeum]|uniref:ATP-binding cassette domain-containing protein n=1 Tax=Blautia obeum TaxID=40520 RepID=A0A414JAF0_9FIRM|nr:ATP-binding cassette domain-containing protein [Blautia obeum]RHE41409.1 ATP-binding cassette domain-containing protein [Blautia obeum]
MSYIQMNQVSFSYGEKNEYVIKDFSIQVQKGEFLVIIGPSGCGKSTLLSLLAGLRLPEKGTITIDGKPVEGPGLDKSVIFQHYSLFPWMTVEENICFGIRQAHGKLKKKDQKALAMDVLTRVGMEQDAEKYPCELSGGMQQRTAIARTLAMDSEIFLMDEPFGAVDPRRRNQLQELLLSVWEGKRREGAEKTVIFVTHDIDEAISLADRILFMGKNGHKEEMQVNLKRPRMLQQLAGTDCFCSFRKKLVDLFVEAEGEEE